MNFNYLVPKFECELSRRNSYYLASFLYRDIPPYIKEAESKLILFKKQVNKWLLEINIHSVICMLSALTCSFILVSSMFILQVKKDAPMVGLIWWLNIFPIYLTTILVLPTPEVNHKQY